MKKKPKKRIIKIILLFNNLFEIDLKDDKKSKEMYNSLNTLISILFAIVFAVGLSELNNIKSPIDSSILVLAYITVLLSWWGYHYGTIRFEKETNILNYIIDILLLFIYWFLMNKRDSLNHILKLYCMMFFLYFLWESIRWAKDRDKLILTSLAINAIFTVMASFLLIFNTFIDKSSFWFHEIHYILALYFLLFGYRIVFHIYLYFLKKN